MTNVVLWHFQGSHFCEKARWALDFKGIPHTRRALGASYLPRAWWRTGRGTLPVLWLGGRAIGDSTRIIEALERYRAEPPLYPEDPAQRARALELAEFFDEELGHPLRAAAVLRPLLDEPAFIAGFASQGLGERERSRNTGVLLMESYKGLLFSYKLFPDTLITDSVAQLIRRVMT